MFTFFNNPVAVASIGVDKQDYDLLADHPNLAVVPIAFVYIQTGVDIHGTVSTTPAFSIGTARPGAIIFLINLGNIFGAGGKGGDGGTNLSGGLPGAAGGTALDTNVDLSVINSGNIHAGGAGGGGGGDVFLLESTRLGGGGAGGGAGPGVAVNGAGGAGGTGVIPINDGAAGNAGTDSVGGVGGVGGFIIPSGDIFGGTGGTGGATGAAGVTGATGTAPGGWTKPAGGAGGAAGKAVALNGKTITWLSGNNPTQVKGTVS